MPGSRVRVPPQLLDHDLRTCNGTPVGVPLLRFGRGAGIQSLGWQIRLQDRREYHWDDESVLLQLSGLIVHANRELREPVSVDDGSTHDRTPPSVRKTLQAFELCPLSISVRP